MLFLILSLIVFHGLHSVQMAAPDFRAKQIERMGPDRWKGVYSLLSILAFVGIIFGYRAAYPAAPQLWNAPTWINHAVILLILPAFMLVPFNMRSSRFTKHPFVLAVLIWSLAHLVANGNLASVLTFGSFFAWAHWNIIAASKQGRDAVPVAPLAQDLAALGAGAAIWALFVFWAHEWLFGVSPLGL